MISSLKYQCVDHPDQLNQILALQAINLIAAISQEEKNEQGFVTVKHDLETLAQMNDPFPHVIALDGDRVVGYCLVMLQSMRDRVQILKSMFDQIDNQHIDGVSLREINYLVMGQVCIDKDYRGQGVFHHMYDHMKSVMSPTFDMIITEISSHNTRSIRAHEKQGFKTLHKFDDPVDAHPWEIVYWDWR